MRNYFNYFTEIEERFQQRRGSILLLSTLDWALVDMWRQAGIPLEGAADHGVSEALYLRDPDDNGVELYWDRPPGQWPRNADGTLAMFTRALDLEALLREAESAPDGDRAS